ncbi:DegT/DnrJ/EryC1/StrS family aminotransferase [Zooshikella sp. RANM57]|uniref:DegT/DnrJ/EryC1/StrS family aminotransferase n=1 Tax=Zooshikella sp. RANM57 TaxID=3425863 RepID=UPI003D6DCC7C
MINVTRSHLPSREKLDTYISQLYDSAYLTNFGPLEQQLTKALEQYLNINHLVLMANGTLALMLLIRGLGLKGEVITTSYTFPATAAAICWSGLEPKFADINASDWTIDPNKIEDLITPQTAAILATHVYGNPCDIEALTTLGEQYKLPVLYDGAHGFGIQYAEQSLLGMGVGTAVSFHATKLFHTVEGGGVIVADSDLAARLKRLINFGIAGPEQVSEVGINAKMSELHAAVGLANLQEINDCIRLRQSHLYYYQQRLDHSGIQWQQWRMNSTTNGAYAPVNLPSEQSLLNVKQQLEVNNIFPRRYFYPSLDVLPCHGAPKNTPNAQHIAATTLCLPLYAELTQAQLDLICDTVLSSL